MLDAYQNIKLTVPTSF